MDAFVDGKDDARTGALRLVPWGRGWRDMAPAIDALEISVLERRFQYPGNPVLTFCFANAVSITDASGNRKLDKSATRFNEAPFKDWVLPTGLDRIHRKLATVSDGDRQMVSILTFSRQMFVVASRRQCAAQEIRAIRGAGARRRHLPVGDGHAADIACAEDFELERCNTNSPRH